MIRSFHCGERVVAKPRTSKALAMGVWPLRFRAVKAFGYSAINCGTRRQSRSELPQALCKGKLPFLPASCVMSGCLTIRNSTVVLCPYSQADIATVKILSARHIRGPKQLDYWCLRSVAHSPVQQAPAILGVQEDGRMVGWSDGRIVGSSDRRQSTVRRTPAGDASAAPGGTACRRRIARCGCSTTEQIAGASVPGLASEGRP